MAGVVYDTGVLVAAERRERRLWAMHDEILTLNVVPVVPVVVLAQAWRGGPQPELSRLLRGCEVTGDTEAIGRAAGRACAVAGSADVVDAIVVVTALQRDAVVFTSDSNDLNRLTNALGTRLAIRQV